jgi:hypothetical protein
MARARHDAMRAAHPIDSFLDETQRFSFLQHVMTFL